jgi:hypothetical protein
MSTEYTELLSNWRYVTPTNVSTPINNTVVGAVMFVELHKIAMTII